jgi:t-SNARE complex subunit (syntaxin)
MEFNNEIVEFINRYSNIKVEYNNTENVIKNIDMLHKDILKNLDLQKEISREERNIICDEIILATGALERIKNILNDNLNDSID